MSKTDVESFQVGITLAKELYTAKLKAMKVGYHVELLSCTRTSFYATV